MGANDPDELLILREGLRDPRLERFIETKPGHCLISLGELLMRRLRGALLLHPSLEFV
ncbi:hypothetical protein ACQR1W_37245 [Bradyrhizobium sp. HKCCYLS1011]|uniref:hypothetical protein n=1 Tax=Bradyrhizobium sp. HKCCYLS1011 TaxID=3420733 RepID=UPI003EC017AC